jgi:hypothetical protein
MRREFWLAMASKRNPKIWGPEASTNRTPAYQNRSNIFLKWPRRRGPKNTLRYTARTQQGLVPLALASLGLGSCWPLLGRA